MRFGTLHYRKLCHNDYKAICCKFLAPHLCKLDIHCTSYGIHSLGQGPSDLFNKSARALSAARWLRMKRLFPNTRKVLALKAHPNQGKNETFEVKVEKENSVRPHVG